MASLYTRKDSKFIWVKFRDPDTGKPSGVSSGVEAKSPQAQRKANAVCATYTTKELAAPTRSNSRQEFSQWAEAFLQEHTKENKTTLLCYMQGLRDLLVFFKALNIATPRQVTYEIACRFVPWRLSPAGIKATGSEIGTNTAWQRFVVLRILLREAMLRGYCEGNLTREVKMSRTKAKSKLEITAEHEKQIDKILKGKPGWMAECWLIMMRQGCRVAETKVPMERIDTDAMTITFKIKGGGLHTASLHPDLLPLIAKARKENRPTLIVAPKSHACCMNMLFIRAELPYSCHCARVTVITRLIRAGHPVAQVSNFVGHSEEVDRIYQKLKPADSAALLTTLKAAA